MERHIFSVTEVNELVKLLLITEPHALRHLRPGRDLQL